MKLTKVVQLSLPSVRQSAKVNHTWFSKFMFWLTRHGHFATKLVALQLRHSSACVYALRFIYG